MKSRTSLFMLLAVVALTFLSSPAAAVVYYVDGVSPDARKLKSGKTNENILIEESQLHLLRYKHP